MSPSFRDSPKPDTRGGAAYASQDGAGEDQRAFPRDRQGVQLEYSQRGEVNRQQLKQPRFASFLPQDHERRVPRRNPPNSIAFGGGDADSNARYRDNIQYEAAATGGYAASGYDEKMGQLERERMEKAREKALAKEKWEQEQREQEELARQRHNEAEQSVEGRAHPPVPKPRQRAGDAGRAPLTNQQSSPPLGPRLTNSRMSMLPDINQLPSPEVRESDQKLDQLKELRRKEEGNRQLVQWLKVCGMFADVLRRSIFLYHIVYWYKPHPSAVRLHYRVRCKVCTRARTHTHTHTHTHFCHNVFSIVSTPLTFLRRMQRGVANTLPMW